MPNPLTPTADRHWLTAGLRYLTHAERAELDDELRYEEFERRCKEQKEANDEDVLHGGD